MNIRKNNWVRVFVSHKEEDKDLAFATRQILEARCNNLRCFVSGADYSHDWLNTIKSELASADVLLLLFTSPAKQWDWPLYEVGLFTPLEEDLPNRSIVYLYSGDHRPAPLKHLQGVRVDPKKLKPIEEFLAKFYKTAEITGIEPPLLPRITKKELLDRAKKLSQAFMTAASVPIYPTYRIVLKAPIENDGSISIKNTTIPNECRVEKVSQPTLSIFGFVHNPETWGQLLTTITDDIEWKYELDEQFNRAKLGLLAYPTNYTFRSLSDNRNFRAMITRIERADQRILRIAIAFIPVHSPAKFGGPAFNLLRFATRFQYEVLNNFSGQLKDSISNVGKERTYNNLLGAIRNIEREANEFRFLDASTVSSAFSEENIDRAEVAKMFKVWGPLREKLFHFAGEMNLSETEALLGDLNKMNMRFLRMVARRHCDLIEKDAVTVLDD